jgi:hypothetical protein
MSEVKLSYQEIIEILKEKIESVDQFAYSDYNREELGLGPITEVASGGGMDKGSDWFRVLYFTDHDVYIQVAGFYSSHHGTDFDEGWDSLSNVKPQEKTIIEYV